MATGWFPAMLPVVEAMLNSPVECLVLSSTAGFPSIHHAMSPTATLPSWQERHFAVGPLYVSPLNVGYVVPAVVAGTSHLKVLVESVWFHSSSVERALCGVWQKVQRPTPPPLLEKSWDVPAIPPPGAAHAKAGASAMTARRRTNFRSFILFHLLSLLFRSAEQQFAPSPSFAARHHPPFPRRSARGSCPTTTCLRAGTPPPDG